MTIKIDTVSVNRKGLTSPGKAFSTSEGRSAFAEKVVSKANAGVNVTSKGFLNRIFSRMSLPESFAFIYDLQNSKNIERIKPFLK